VRKGATGVGIVRAFVDDLRASHGALPARAEAL
jgi:hypothetical protein